MKWVKRIAAVTALYYIICVISGVKYFFITSSGIVVAYSTMTERIQPTLVARVLAIFAFGVQKRSPIAWSAGFLLLATFYVGAVAGITASLSHTAHVRDFPSFWLPIGIVAMVLMALSILGALWWKRQRSYFR
jgi:hypothetical protein